MKMKIIVDIDESIEIDEALNCLKAVFKAGKISEGRGIPHYCWLTVFDNKTVVATKQKKTVDSADSFRIYKND